MFPLTLRPLVITFSVLIILCSSGDPVLATPNIDGAGSQSQLSTTTTSSSSSPLPSTPATLPFLYGKLADKFLRINDAYLGRKSFALPDDALPASGVSYSSDHHHSHPYPHHPIQGQHQRQHEHDASDSFYGPPVPPSEYQPPNRPFVRPFVSWSNKAKVYSFKSCLSAMKKVRKHVAKEE